MESKQILSIEQMQHLQELGLELKDTMLYWIKPLDAVIGIVFGLENDWLLDFIDDKKKKYLKYIPAYTLQDVLDALPKEIKYAGERCWLCLEAADERIGYYNEDCNFNREYVYYDVKETYESNIIDSAYRLLCWVIENKFVETNKNE